MAEFTECPNQLLSWAYGAVQPSRSNSEFVKASVLMHLGRVIGDAHKAYEGLREINLRQAPFTVPPPFANVTYKCTDIQLRNHQARKKRQQLQETNIEWLKYFDGEVVESMIVPQPMKRKHAAKSSPQEAEGQEKQLASTTPEKITVKIKKPRAPRKPKVNP